MNSEERSNEREAIRQRSQRLHATGTGNALVVADDVRSLLDRLAAVERERDALRAQLDKIRPKYRAAFDDKHAMRRERDAALARIAAVEALCNEVDKPQDWRDLMFDGTPFPRLLNVEVVRAALAASPTPGRCGEFGIELQGMRCEYGPSRHTHYPVAASPTPTTEEQR